MGHPTSQELISWSPFSPVIQRAWQSLACLKCLVDVKQVICSRSFCSQTFLKEVNLSARIAVFELSQNPLSKSCERPAVAACVLEQLLGRAPFWGVSPSLACGSPGTGAQGGFVTWHLSWSEQALVEVTHALPFALLGVSRGQSLSPPAPPKLANASPSTVSNRPWALRRL